MTGRATGLAILLVALLAPPRAAAQVDSLVGARNDSVSARLVNVDLRLAIQTLARYLDRPVLFGNIGDVRVTLETPQPIARAQLPELLRGMLKTYGLALTEQPGFYTVEPIQQAAPPTTTGTGPVQLFVLRVRHARAADVAATVNALYGRGSALGEIGAPRPTLAEGLRQNLVPPAGTPEPGQQQPLVAQNAELGGDVTIIPDPRTNSLLVRATQQDFTLIRAAVEQLDVRPLQVLIEVIIAEVRRDRSLSFGVGVTLPAQQVPGKDARVSGSTTGLGSGDFVLQIMNVGGANLNATLAAAATRGDVTILSRPVLLAANNENAEILVGSQRPFIQVQRALPTDAPLRDQVVQFKDVGTRLSVRPTISDDGYVTLRVSQEVNAATAEVAFDAPVISTRTIQTQLLVKDGHTAVLGGLTDHQRDETRAGVPFLSSLPLVGGLFGKQVQHTTDTELFVFLTPRVIRSDDELDSASHDIGDKTKKVREPVAPAPSSLRQVHRASPVFFAGHLGGDRGKAGVGPSNALAFGVRYELATSRSTLAQFTASYLKGDRFIVNPAVSPDSLGQRTGPADVDLLFAEVALQVRPLADRTWHRLSPYFGAGIGMVADVGSPGDTTGSGYRFRNKLTFGGIGGVRWQATPKLTVQLDARAVMWRLRYPVSFHSAAPDGSRVIPLSEPLTEWTLHPLISLGVGWTL